MLNHLSARYLISIAAFAATAALASCSAAGPDTPKVASLVTSESPASATAANGAQPGDANRPRYRLDMTAADQDAITAPYVKCMIDHGVSSARDRKFSNTQARDEPQSTLEAAQKACAENIPLPAWENDPRNPAALDFNRKVVTCLQGKGVREVQVFQSDGEINISLGGPKNDQQSINLGMQHLVECQKQVSN